MDVTSENKEKHEKTETKEQVKEILNKAGAELSDTEAETVAGGVYHQPKNKDEHLLIQ